MMMIIMNWRRGHQPKENMLPDLTKEPAFASQCVGYGKCEQHCPQSIPIRKKLKEADKA